MSYATLTIQVNAETAGAAACAGVGAGAAVGRRLPAGGTCGDASTEEEDVYPGRTCAHALRHRVRRIVDVCRRPRAAVHVAPAAQKYLGDVAKMTYRPALFAPAG